MSYGDPDEGIETAETADQINRIVGAGLKRQTSAINDAFTQANRGAFYDQHRENVIKHGTKKVNRKYETAQRQNRFNLARAGLLGGSEHAGTKGQLAENYGEELVEVNRRGNLAKQNVMKQDLGEKSRMLSSVGLAKDLPFPFNRATDRVQMWTPESLARGMTRALSNITQESGGGSFSPFLNNLGGNLLDDISAGISYEEMPGQQAGVDVITSYFKPKEDESENVEKIS
jgi:hypothetical protein